MNASRAPAIVVLSALAVGVVLFAVDGIPRGVGVEFPTAPAEVSPSGTSGDLWFCLGPTTDLQGITGRVVTLVSHASEDMEGRVTVADDAGRAVERTVRVAAGGHLDIRPGQSVPGATWAAVTVEVPLGQVVVEVADCAPLVVVVRDAGLVCLDLRFPFKCIPDLAQILEAID